MVEIEINIPEKPKTSLWKKKAILSQNCVCSLQLQDHKQPQIDVTVFIWKPANFREF